MNAPPAPAQPTMCRPRSLGIRICLDNRRAPSLRSSPRQRRSVTDPLAWHEPGHDPAQISHRRPARAGLRGIARSTEGTLSSLFHATPPLIPLASRDFDYSNSPACDQSAWACHMRRDRIVSRSLLPKDVPSSCRCCCVGQAATFAGRCTAAQRYNQSSMRETHGHRTTSRETDLSRPWRRHSCRSPACAGDGARADRRNACRQPRRRAATHLPQWPSAEQCRGVHGVLGRGLEHDASSSSRPRSTISSTSL